jgi:protein TonB
MRLIILRALLICLCLDCAAGNAQGGIGSNAPEKKLESHRPVTAPRAIYTTDPKYPKLPRKQKRVEGTEILWLVVGVDGKAHDIEVEQSLGKEFDDSAIDAVSKWRFQPATQDGQPVAVNLHIQLHFKHY